MHILLDAFFLGGGELGGGGGVDEHRLEHCLHYIIRLSSSCITTLTPSPLKTNLKFQSVGLLTGQSVGLDEEIGISS